MLRALLLFCAFLSAGLPTQPAEARPREREQRQEQREARPREEQVRPARRDGSAAAARQAQARNGGGRVLSVDPEGDGYRVKVLKDGEVRTHHVVVD